MRRRGILGGRPRTALPPLHDKHVEIVEMLPMVMPKSPFKHGQTLYRIHLLIDAKTYRIDRWAKDELEIMVWLMKLQTKEPGGETNHNRG